MRAVPADIIAAAQTAARKWGVFASVTLAQWALESAWGARYSGKLNPFGIKALPDQPGTVCQTHEVIKGRSEQEPCRFRDFSSIADAFDAHGRLIATGVPYKAAMAHKGDLSTFVRLMAEHYATDPRYASKVLELIQEEGFTRYDLKLKAAA